VAKCADCGFLAVRHIQTRNLEEVEYESRQEGEILTNRYYRYPVCFVMAVNLRERLEEIENLPENAPRQQDAYGNYTWPTWEDLVKILIDNERECELFTKWRQGYTPKEHQEMMDRERRDKFEQEIRKIERDWQERQRKLDRQWQAKQQIYLVIVAGIFTLIGAALPYLFNAVSQLLPSLKL